MTTDQVLLTALTGGVAGAILTLLTQWLIRYWNRPILEITADEDGCDVITDGWLVDSQRALLKDASGKPIKVKQHYLRFSIANGGRTFAKNASVCVTQIIYRGEGSGAAKTIFKAEVFELKLALTWDKAIFDLASKSHRFVDFVHCQQNSDGSVAMVFDFLTGSALLPPLNFGKGQYEVKVSVAAENAQSNISDFKWKWDGTLDGLMMIS